MSCIKCSIIVVVGDVLIDDDYGVPSVEEGVGNNGSYRRAADDIHSIDIATIDTVVEVVGDAMEVYRTDVTRNIVMVSKVVVVGVHIRSGSGTVTGAV